MTSGSQCLNRGAGCGEPRDEARVKRRCNAWDATVTNQPLLIAFLSQGGVDRDAACTTASGKLKHFSTICRLRVKQTANHVGIVQFIGVEQHCLWPASHVV